MNHHDCSDYNQDSVEASVSFNFNSFSKLMSAIALQSKSLLSYAWKAISTPVSSEPRVWQRRDRSGQTYWQVYDPETNRSARLSSEQEVRQWLEQRYYQPRNL
ncbi:hypothetical protein LEP3755_59650 [Leptolyngbya sp. NIES-3755]|nr:hypothetical protein LEP3755_59650 [Leptolyngbya sp. NIES-3755]